MAARHHFYGKLYVDDIADLAAYVASHAGSAFNWRGNWAPNFAYAAGDGFAYGGSSYYVLSAFTSGTTFSTANLALLAAKGTDGLNGTNGTNGADSTVPGPKGEKGDPGPTGASGLTFRGPWSAGNSYAVNDLVTWGGSGYVASVAKAAGSPPPTGTAADPGLDDTAVNAGWSLLVLEGARGPQGIAGTNGTNGTNGLNGRGFTPRGAWATGTNYVVDDIVTYLGATWRVTTAHTSTATGATGAPALTGASAGNWELWAAKGDQGVKGVDGTNGTNGTNGQGFTPRGAWAANTLYNAYDVLTYQGSTYLVMTGFTSGSTFSAANLALWAAKGDPGVAGSAASAGSAPAYGMTFNPVTGHLVLEVVQPDSGETFAAYKYDETFLGLGNLTFSWSTTNPTHLMMGIA